MAELGFQSWATGHKTRRRQPNESIETISTNCIRLNTFLRSLLCACVRTIFKAPKIKKQTSLHLPNARADRSSPFAGSRRMRLVFVGHEAQDRMRSPAQQGWRAHHQRRVEEGPPHRAAVVAGEEGRTDRDERTDEEGNRTAPWTGGSDGESSGAGRGRRTRSGTDIRWRFRVADSHVASRSV